MLKPFPEILKPDLRHMPGGPFEAVIGNHLEQLYLDIAPLELAPQVPEEVRWQFDSARHAFVYSWFCYELLTLAEQQAYAALENGLRARIAASTAIFKGKGLDALFQCVCKQGWLVKSDFEVAGGLNLLEVVRTARNHLSHGQPQLSLHFSLEMLRLCATILNKVFETKKRD